MMGPHAIGNELHLLYIEQEESLYQRQSIVFSVPIAVSNTGP
jgi:hypothetical protein